MTDLPQALDRIRAWGETCDWNGYDPYDGLNSPLAPYLTMGTKLGRRLLTQAVKLAPVNFRPALRVSPERNSKGIALVASAYARLWAADGDEMARARALKWLEWLGESSTADVGLGWGYHFDVQTRLFAYPRGTPNLIATSFAAHSLLDGYELLAAEHCGEAAERACEFLITKLLDEHGERTYFRYLAREAELVHNANLLGCSVLARTSLLRGRTDLDRLVRDALASSLRAQSRLGSWPYSDAHDWIDNFHSGYVLQALSMCEPVEPDIRPRLEAGLMYWERELFLTDGTPKYYSNRVFPIDAHNYAQAIETWLSVASWKHGALTAAEHCAELLIERMLTPAGYIAFQQRRFWTSKIPYVRWTTAPTFRALAGLRLAKARRATIVATAPVGLPTADHA